MRTVVGIVAAALALVGAVGCNRSSGEERAPEGAETEKARDFLKLDPHSPRLAFLKIETVHETDAPATISLPGRVLVDEDHTQRVASPIDGRAIAILVKLGDKVRAGQPLVELSSAQVGQIQAEAQKAAQDLSVAERGLTRAHRLQADGAISDKEVAQIEADSKKAKADVGRSEAQLRALGISPSDPAVKVALRAQIAGTVIERNVLLGQEVRADAAAPLLTISAIDKVWVVGSVYERDLALIQEDATVRIEVPAYPGDVFAGKITHVGDVVDPTTRTVPIRCAVDNPAHRLKPEMFATIQVQSVPGQRFITIPSRAVLADGEKFQVVIASEGNVFRARSVDVGSEIGDKVRVLRGLATGENIVSDGALFLKQELTE
jgi:membrane fusion protein, heavy metal efflux system